MQQSTQRFPRWTAVMLNTDTNPIVDDIELTLCGENTTAAKLAALVGLPLCLETIVSSYSIG